MSLILITNGSFMARSEIQRGLMRWSQFCGRVWFKIDSVTTAGVRRINHVQLTPQKIIRNLEICARLCSTWIQTCLFAWDGQGPDEIEQQAYIEFLQEIQHRNIPVAGVLLYGLARPSMQTEAPRLSKLPKSWFITFGKRIQDLGLTVLINE